MDLFTCRPIARLCRGEFARLARRSERRGVGQLCAPEWTEEATDVHASFQTFPNGYPLLVGRRVENLERFNLKITEGLIWAAALFLLLATAAGISTSRRSVARIEAINATSREIIRTGLRQPIPGRGTTDEWDELARNLDSMLDRIEELVESNRQVSDAIAHDLRTPLSRMRGRLERAYNRALIGKVISELGMFGLRKSGNARDAIT